MPAPQLGMHGLHGKSGWSGRYNSALFEHAYLAENIGAILAFPEDLKVVGNAAGHLTRTDGPRQPSRSW